MTPPISAICPISTRELHDTLHGGEPALDLTDAPAAEEPAAPRREERLSRQRPQGGAGASASQAREAEEPRRREAAEVERESAEWKRRSSACVDRAASSCGARRASSRRWWWAARNTSTTATKTPAMPNRSRRSRRRRRRQRSDPNAAFEAPPPIRSRKRRPKAWRPMTTATGEGAPMAQNDTATTTGATPVVAGPLPRAQRRRSNKPRRAGDLTAQYELGLQRIAAGRAQEGVTLLRRAADRGFAMAQYRLAKLYERGEGVQADLAVARQWTERAAAGGQSARHARSRRLFRARRRRAAGRSGGVPLVPPSGGAGRRGQPVQSGRPLPAGPRRECERRRRRCSGSWSPRAKAIRTPARAATALEGQLQQNQVEQARARAQAFRPRAASAVANGEFGQRAWAARPAT